MTGVWDITMFSGFITAPGECNSEHCTKCEKNLTEIQLLTNNERGDFCWNCGIKILKKMRKKK